MFKALLVLVLFFLPSAALADDASLLGPSSIASTGPSSAQSESLLQPASPSSLQPTGAADSSSTTDSQALQQTASSDTTKLLVQGEADAPKKFTDNHSDYTPLYLIFGLLILSAGVFYFARKKPLGQSST